MKSSLAFCGLGAMAVTLFITASPTAQTAGQTGALVRLQASSPGASQVGHLNISGTATMGGFRLGTSATPGYVLTANASGAGSWQPSGGSAWATSGNDIFNTNSGNVGIGTSTPPHQLSITGGIGFANHGNAHHKKLWSPWDGVLRWTTHNAASSHGFEVGHQGDPAAVYLNTLGSSWLTGGSVGIGTTVPSGLLDVKGNIHMTGERTKLFYRGDSDAQIGALGIYGIDGGTLCVLDPYGSSGNLANSTIRMGGFGLFNDNTVNLEISGNVGVGTLVDPTMGLVSVTLVADGSGTVGVAPVGDYAYGIWGLTNSGFGVVGEGLDDFGVGVSGTGWGTLGVGVEGGTDDLEGGWGVFSWGDFGADGGKYFHIDHPLDPANKYLNHACAEGPEALNLYSGNTVMGENGEAWVELPGYFEAINKDFRYSLTAIGSAAPSLHVAVEISENRFKIGGGQPGLKVSWRVEGVRNDPYMQRYRKPVEQEKPDSHKGRYLRPELYDQPKELGVHYRRKSGTKKEAAARQLTNRSDAVTRPTQ